MDSRKCFTTFSTFIIKVLQERSGTIGQQSPLLLYFNKYLRQAERDKDSLNKINDTFVNLFLENRKEILEGVREDDWLVEGKIILYWKGGKQDEKVPLSLIYKTTKQMKK